MTIRCPISNNPVHKETGLVTWHGPVRWSPLRWRRLGLILGEFLIPLDALLQFCLGVLGMAFQLAVVVLEKPQLILRLFPTLKHFVLVRLKATMLFVDLDLLGLERFRVLGSEELDGKRTGQHYQREDFQCHAICAC